MALELWTTKHPWYEERERDWAKFRLTYQGGQRFIDTYLQRFSKREQPDDFTLRKIVTYCPSFAASAINDIKNSIYQRMVEITRVGGDSSYQDAISGVGGGVDLKGGTMNNFIGQIALPELLIMGRVGIFVDMPPVEGDTLADFKGKSPYLYTFTAEQIPSWNYCYQDGEQILTSVLLREINQVEDPDTGLVKGNEETLRLLKLDIDGVHVQFFDKANKLINETLLKGMKRIPFIMAEINHSLLKDVANYQIALLNMESADISYILRANFPFYTEPYDPKSGSAFIAPGPGGELDTAENAQVTAAQAKAQEINVGPVSGRRYPTGVGSPAFIHPSSEPLKASMDKQAHMKNDIRALVNLALASVEPKFASAESKQMDDRSLEAGLSYIGLEFERVERQVAQIWAAYVGKQDKIATIKYPRKYSLKTDKDRRDEAKEYSDLVPKIPSKIGKKEITKVLVRALLEQKVSDKVLSDIDKEIDAADYVASDAKDIQIDVEAGLVSAETASNARGYDGKKEVPVAQKEHADRLARIAASQSVGAANGVPDASGDPGLAAKLQKDKSQKNKDALPAGSNPTRGEGK
jgi:hypothetical protein